MSSHPSPRTIPTASIASAAALALIDAARVAAEQMGVAVAAAITDAGGHLKAFERNDRVPFLTVDAAIDKAWTAASFGMATHEWVSILANPEVSGLAHRPRFIGVGGGVPIVEGGRVVGAIGISGGNALQDQQIAEAALAKVGFDPVG